MICLIWLAPPHSLGHTHRWSQSHAMLLVESTEWIPPFHYGRTTHMCRVQGGRVLRPVDSDRNLARRRAQLLVQPAVRTDPHVLLCDFHLRRNVKERVTERLTSHHSGVRTAKWHVDTLTEVRNPLPGA